MPKTDSAALQTKFDLWNDMLVRAASATHGSAERKEVVETFCATFVPPDVNEEDTLAYAESLLGDDEAFLALVREIGQCAEGSRVESIAEGETEHSFIFTLLPPEDADVRGLDIVRELGFVSEDGINWTAEG